MQQSSTKTLFWMLLVIHILNLLITGESHPQAGVIYNGSNASFTNFTLSPKVSKYSFPAGHNTNESIYSVFRSKAPRIIIERGQTYANGCYQQTVEEPFHGDKKRFIYTEQLVCPSGVNVSSIPQRLLIPANEPSFVPISKTQPAADSIQWNTSAPAILPFFAPAYVAPADLNVFENETIIEALPPPLIRLEPLYDTGEPDVFSANQSIIGKVPQEENTYVILLAQNTGYYVNQTKSNAAPVNCLAMVNVIITLFICFT